MQPATLRVAHGCRRLAGATGRTAVGLVGGRLPAVFRFKREARMDHRLYVPEHEGWSTGIQDDRSKEYCFAQKPGEDHYHLLVAGEIYLRRGSEKYCLNCALRHGFATRDRTFWQRGPSSVADDEPAGEWSREGSPPETGESS
jgi:hypothetical protein